MTSSTPRRAGRPRTNRQPIERPPRQEAIAVASRLFAEKGFAATTMREIAERSGLQQSSIYYYFKSKDEILEAIVGEVNSLVLEGFARIARDGGSPGLRLFRTLRLDVTMLCGLPYDVNEILRLPTLQEERFAAYWKERQQLNDAVEGLLAEGVAGGELVEMDVRLAALSLLSNDEAVQNWYRPMGEHRLVGDYEPHEIGEFLASMALQAFLVDRRRLSAIRRRADELDGRV